MITEGESDGGGWGEDVAKRWESRKREADAAEVVGLDRRKPMAARDKNERGVPIVGG